MSSAGGESIQLPGGNHRLPFTFTLPANVPSSFEGEVGSVRYTAEATMERPWKFNHTTRSAFTVISIVDLNMESPEFRVNLSSYFLTYLPVIEVRTGIKLYDILFPFRTEFLFAKFYNALQKNSELKKNDGNVIHLQITTYFYASACLPPIHTSIVLPSGEFGCKCNDVQMYILRAKKSMIFRSELNVTLI